MKAPVLIAILFLAMMFGFTLARAQNIKVIQADTLFKGYDSGETYSVKIVNHGTSLIYNHAGKLYEMSALTYEPLREIKLEEIRPISYFSVDENCKYIIYNTNSDTVTFVADYNTGKTIKTIVGTYHLGYHYIYTVHFFEGSDISIIRYNLSDLTPVDTFVHKFKTHSDYFLKYKALKTVPNTEKIIVSIGGTYYSRSMYDMNYSYTMIDFAKDSVKGIGFKQSSTDEGSAYSVLSISEDLNYFILGKSEYDTYSDADRKMYTICLDTHFFIHDSNYKCVDIIYKSKIRNLLNDPALEFYLNGIIVENRYFIFQILRLINGMTKRQVMIYDLKNKVPFAIVDFDANSFSYDGKFIFCNSNGCLATLTLDQLPVIDKTELFTDYSVSFSNNNLLVSAKETQEVNISIMNMTGVEVETLSNIYLSEGPNTIPLNTQLANGLYFCIIKTHDTSISRKFMVIK